MADEHEPQQQSTFHWPPTPEELDTIQVVDMQGRPVRPGDTRRWRTGVAKASIAQVGVLAASLAAIGIALTSMLATPAQPTASRAARGEAAAAVTATATPSPRPSPPQAAAAAASVDDSAAFANDSTPAFRPMVTLEIEKPSAADVRKPEARRETFGSWPPPQHVATAAEATPAQLASTQPRPTRGARTAERRVAKRDPVAKFAVHTGQSVWKAMRAVGRSFKRQGDDEFFTRSAGGRRTARAASLPAETAPSDR